MAIAKVIEEAIRIGFSNAAPLKMDTLRFLPEVRDMCRADRCRSFGKSWMCPPGCGTLEECAARAAGFLEGVIVQSVGELDDPFDVENMQMIEESHKKRFQELAISLSSGSFLVLALGAGACRLCEVCSYPDAPCRFPGKAQSSMEANGLWVSDVCEKNGVPYNYGPNKMAFTSCILIAERE